MATATETKPKRSPALCETRVDESGVHITLPKSSAVALVKARNVCSALAQAAPIIKEHANGLRKSLDALIEKLSNGPIPVTDLEEEETRDTQ